eukprot:10076061-Prorocentrum_lima.AAC.1
MIAALSSTTLLEEIQDNCGSYHQLDKDIICQALKTLHAKGLMHLHCVKMLYSCDLAAKYPQRTVVCRKRECSLAKVNESFPAM